MLNGLKSAIVHDRFTTYAGSEKVVEAIQEDFPSSLYAIMVNKELIKGTVFENINIHTSFVQRLPRVEKAYQIYLPLYPLAVEQFDLSAFDIIISSSHTVAKGVLTNPDQLHICYCHTPMRYAWDLYHDYLKSSGLEKGIKGGLARLFLHYLRMWDILTLSRVDHFIANSLHVARRIRKTYGRDSTVIYPPVDVDRFAACSDKDNYYITVSRLVQYKKVDMIIEAFSLMPDKKLVVIGDGPDMRKIKARASKNIELLGYQSDDALIAHLCRAKAFVFAAEEDFGIAPVEAQACGTPVIAYGKGGVLETVAQGKTGILFPEQNVRSLIQAVTEFERTQAQFDPLVIRKNAERFSKQRFKKEFKKFVDDRVEVFLAERRTGCSPNSNTLISSGAG